MSGHRLTIGIAMGFLAAASAGCHVAGPAGIRVGRSSYNVAVQRTNDEQLLLNLVRLRYLDTPYFLQVGSVASSLSVGGELLGSAYLPEAALKSLTLTASTSYTERPTVSYAPLQGDRFVSQLLSPVQLKALLLLYHSGWSSERILRLCFHRIKGLLNAPGASGPTPARAPKYKEFLAAAKLLQRLQDEQILRIGVQPAKPGAGPRASGAAAPPAGKGRKPPEPDMVIQLKVVPEATNRPEVKKLRKFLNLPDDANYFVLTRELGVGPPENIGVLTRSLMATLFYLSQFVEVPAGDEKAGRVRVTRDSEGRRFDWGRLGCGLMRIRSSRLPPPSAYVAVPYRGTWFYIDDADLDSKSTFALLTQLFALQAGGTVAPGPVLTLPVSE